MQIDGMRLRRLRLERALTQQELSQMTGIAQDSISKLERGYRPPLPSTVRKLAEALAVEPIELMRRSSEDA